MNTDCTGCHTLASAMRHTHTELCKILGLSWWETTPLDLRRNLSREVREADELSESTAKFEMELCEILGLEWTETKWGDIQNAVRQLKEQTNNG